MTEEKKDQAAQTSIVRKGHTMADVVLTIYDDVKSVEGVQALAKAGNAVLVSAGGPLLLIHREVADFVNERLAKKAENIPPENRQPPDLTTTAKIVPALNVVFGEKDLREMFINLLAATMNKTREGNVLPAFTEVIKQLSSDEAKLLSAFFKMRYLEFPLIDIIAVKPDGGRVIVGYDYGIPPLGDLGSMFVANWHRLGLVRISHIAQQPSAYAAIEDSETMESVQSSIVQEGRTMEIVRKTGEFTTFGIGFLQAVVGE